MTYDILSTNEIDPSDVFDRLKELHDELCSDSADYAAICRGRSIVSLKEFIRFFEEDDEGNCAFYKAADAHFRDDEKMMNFLEEEVGSELEDIRQMLGALDELSYLGSDQIELGGLKFPRTLIVDDGYFEDYIIDYLESSGICSGLEYVVLDKSATADLFRSDYSSIEIGGTNYLYRA